MRKAMVMVLALAACGSESAAPVPGLSGTWSLTDDQGVTWERLTLDANGTYDRWLAFGPLDEGGLWSVEPEGLRLLPDGGPVEMHRYELVGAHWLRIWWPPHLLHEYTRVK